MTEADVVIVGRGALAVFASIAARRRGLEVLRIGTGLPFERFLLLHENALRILERTCGEAVGHPLKGIRVLDRNLEPLREISFTRYGLRLHAMRYTDLLAFLRERDDTREVEGRVVALEPDGVARLEDGREFRARRMVVNTASGFARPRLRFRHRKVFRTGFVDHCPDPDRVVQINDAGTYAAIVPFGRGAAIACSGDTAPLERLFGGDPGLSDFRELRLETWCGTGVRRGRVFHVGEALRRVHPHTGQGLNRALDTVDAIFGNDGLFRERVYDCLMWVGGVMLDLSWGTSPFLRDLSYALLDNAPGMKLLSGTAWWRGSART